MRVSVRGWRSMPLGKYYCDYCNKEFQDTRLARTRHLQSSLHLRAKALWYDSLHLQGTYYFSTLPFSCFLRFPPSDPSSTCCVQNHQTTRHLEKATAKVTAIDSSIRYGKWTSVSYIINISLVRLNYH